MTKCQKDPTWYIFMRRGMCKDQNQNCLGCIFLRIYTLNGQYCLSALPPPTPMPPPHPYWTKFTLGLTCDDFTLSLGPLKAEIHAFSDGLSENDWKSQNERVHKFCSSALVFAGTAILFFPTWKNVSGPYSERFSEIIGNRKHPENTLKRRFPSKKRAERGWKSGARSLS